ncbi:hypothetical protein [Bellilinea sp.]|uniref:hypothetical protein n=1 Tax=Bellilinea sp. TaxID=2838785 RepID=UPI002ADE37F7|nr:hypothetical protein [Bellilinea sp.]
MGEEKPAKRPNVHRQKDRSFSFTLQLNLPNQNHSLRHPRPGKICPVCGLGIMDYDGLLNLVCPVCGFGEGGCFT